MTTISPSNEHQSDYAVTIVLLNYKGWRDTVDCIRSLLNSTIGFNRLILCDNHSPDDSISQLKAALKSLLPEFRNAWQRWGYTYSTEFIFSKRHELQNGFDCTAGIYLIDNEDNLGFATGNNIGLELALRDMTTTHFWLLNNDTVVMPDTLGNLLDAVKQRPQHDLWGLTLAYHNDPEHIQALGGGRVNLRSLETRHIGAFIPIKQTEFNPRFINEIESEMDYIVGASMLASRHWLNTVGYLGQQYFLYYEELDWAFRGKKHGLTLGYAAKANVLHKEGASIGTAPSGGSALSVFHLHRSRILFARSHLTTIALPLVSLISTWQAVKFLLKLKPLLTLAALKGLYSGWRKNLSCNIK